MYFRYVDDTFIIFQNEKELEEFLINPEDYVLKQISKKITQFSRPKRFGPDKCPVYLRVTYPDWAALTLERNLRIAVKNCYGSVALRTVFVSRQMLPASRKDVLPAIRKSFVIYEYKCQCDNRYVGKTAQRLQDRTQVLYRQSLILVHFCTTSKLFTVKFSDLHFSLVKMWSFPLVFLEFD